MTDRRYRRTYLWWQSFLGYLEARFPLSKDSLRAWRERIFFAIFLCSLALGLAPLFSAVRMSIANHLWLNLAAYLGFYLWAGIILFVRRLNFTFRAWNGVIIYFAMGLTALMTLGPASSGRAWFFGSAILASLLLGLRAGLFILAAIAAALFGLGSLLSNGYISWSLLSFYSVDTWYSTATTLLFLCTMVTVSLAVMVAGLERAIVREKSAGARLAETRDALAEEVEQRRKAQDELSRYQANLEKLVQRRTAELAESNRDLHEQIDGRRRTEMALTASEDRYRQLVEHAPAGIFELDLVQEKFLSANHLMCHFTGYRLEEFLAMPSPRLFTPASQGKYRLFRANLLAGEPVSQNQEFRVRRKDGGELWLLLNTNLDRAHDGKLTARVVAQDISDRKKAEKALLHLASGVSHNFNNALMAIITNGQAAQSLLKNRTPDIKEAGDLIENVMQSARSGRDVVKRLSRYVSGYNREGQKYEMLDLGELLDDLRPTLARDLEPIKEGKVTLEIVSRPDVLVRGGRGDLEEVIMTLVKNAVEAMPEGGQVRLTAASEDDRARLEVADTGPGLSREAMDNLFEPFVSAKGDTGLGLGLVVSQEIIRAYSGRLSAANRERGGALFTIDLPLASGRPRPQKQPQPERDATPSRVLLVEDESLVAMGVEFILKEAGHQVRVARDKKSALLALDDYQPQVVLCDLGLPDGSGWDVVIRLEQWAKERELPPVPVVVLTGWTTSVQLNRPEQAPEPFAVMSKPLDRERLLQALSQALAQ